MDSDPTYRFVLPGPHRIRIAFLLSLALFTAYILWRRQRFTP